MTNWLVKPGIAAMGGRSDDTVRWFMRTPTQPGFDILMIHSNSERFAMIVSGVEFQKPPAPVPRWKIFARPPVLPPPKLLPLRVVQLWLPHVIQYIGAVEQKGYFDSSRVLKVFSCYAGVAVGLVINGEKITE